MRTIEATAELSEAVRFAATGTADPDMLRRIAEESSRVRERLLRKHGLLDLAVPLIREIREE
jgi:hypothetical protein